jgi:hypothetical protein
VSQFAGFDDDEASAKDLCPICEAPEGECDHLVASIDRTYSELTAGAIFSHERIVLDLLERMAAREPDLLKAAGAGSELENVATIIAAEMEEGMGAGEAVSMHLPLLLSALGCMLQEQGDVMITDVDASKGEGSSRENFWAEDPEWIVERLLARLQEIADDSESPD